MHQELETQLRLARKQLSGNDMLSPRWPALSVDDVLQTHFLIADFFYSQGEGIGGVGPKDIKLLQSAVDRQYVSSGYLWKWSTTYDLAATLMFGIIRNHPFFDANKRTSVICCAHVLLRDKISLTVSEKDFVRFTGYVAERNLKRFPRFRKIQKSGEPDPEVRFISWYLRTRSRKMSRAWHAITFRDLAKTLSKFGYKLDNPHGNTIDVYYVGGNIESVHNPKNFSAEERICNIGFPGMSRQVAKGDIKRLRKELGMTLNYGIDSATFFEDADPLTNLISSYEGVLRKLAYL